MQHEKIRVELRNVVSSEKINQKQNSKKYCATLIQTIKVNRSIPVSKKKTLFCLKTVLN